VGNVDVVSLPLNDVPIASVLDLLKVMSRVTMIFLEVGS
jgi:hypothetical protein